MAKSKPNAEQGYIEGMEPEKNNRVHAAALRYAKLRDVRMAANKEEKEAHDTLLGTMMEEGLENYEYKNVSVAIDVGRKCKVSTDPKKKAAAKGDDEADEADETEE